VENQTFVNNKLALDIRHLIWRHNIQHKRLVCATEHERHLAQQCSAIMLSIVVPLMGFNLDLSQDVKKRINVTNQGSHAVQGQ